MNPSERETSQYRASRASLGTASGKTSFGSALDLALDPLVVPFVRVFGRLLNPDGRIAVSA